MTLGLLAAGWRSRLRPWLSCVPLALGVEDDFGEELDVSQDVGACLGSFLRACLMIPPLPDVPRYDVLMLIRAHARSELGAVESGLRELDPDFSMPAQNTRRIGETDSTRSASFLFNHFVAQRPAVALEGFDRVAGWFPGKLGVDNTTLLQPVDQATSPYAFVNYVRVPGGARGFLLSMLTRPSFYTQVRRTLSAYEMTALPLLAKPV